MKLRVVGWAAYDDDLPRKRAGWAARNAIIDDIKDHGYLFSGISHQESDLCAPVLSDGYLYYFSQRGWGGVMAEAHGRNEIMAYARYAFGIDRPKEIRPTLQYDEDDFIPEYDLSEKFTLTVKKSVFTSALNKGKIKLDDLPELRYIDIGDTLELKYGGEKAEYKVDDVDRKKDLTEKQLRDLDLDIDDFLDPVKRKRADEEFASAKIILTVKLRPIDSKAPEPNPEDFVIIGGVLTQYKGSGGDVIIPRSVTRIDKKAFGYCKNLTAITIPDTVTEIGEKAFWFCRSLTEIIIPDSVTAIFDYTFRGCDRLACITLPESVTTIGSNAFFGCKNLRNIIFKGTKDRWRSIGKVVYRNSDTGNYTVSCSDGTLTKEESE